MLSDSFNWRRKLCFKTLANCVVARVAAVSIKVSSKMRVKGRMRKMSWPRSCGQRFHRKIAESREKFRKHASKKKKRGRKGNLDYAMEPSSMGGAVLNTCTLLLVTATLKVPVMESERRSKYIKKGGTTQRPTDILHTLFHTGSAYQ